MLWLREMKTFLRARSRIIGNIVQPFFFLAILGIGFRSSMQFTTAGLEGYDYIQFLVPGLVGMTLLFSSMFAGLSVLWDRQFGFLREIMVAPVSRISLVLGRVAGGLTTALFQAVTILLLAHLFGFRILDLQGLLLALGVMALIAVGFVGVGIAFASRMEDMHGFQLVMNFIIMPVFFLSGALFPLTGLPSWLRAITYGNPLAYGVDALRAALLGVASFPLGLDIGVLALFGVATVLVGAYLFTLCEV